MISCLKLLNVKTPSIVWTLISLLPPGSSCSWDTNSSFKMFLMTLIFDGSAPSYLSDLCLSSKLERRQLAAEIFLQLISTAELSVSALLEIIEGFLPGTTLVLVLLEVSSIKRSLSSPLS